MSRHVSNDLKRRARELAAREEIPYSAALARLRTLRDTPARPTDTAAGNPTRFLLPEYLYVPLAAPDLGDARPCDDCQGSGLDAEGRAFAQPSDGGRPPLLVEVVCSKCEGCGRAEHAENGCGHPHTDPDMDDGLYDEDEDEESPCYSCAGREFNYVQAVVSDDQGEPVEAIYLRLPCGCTADRMRVILGDLIEVAG
ncbi:hypothetical protein SAMN05216483_6803 [Streptomyces sp. 2131.1]|uniref:hypothetical protein n=1 Tax=Streptomyces sp. 2131.1 TaxID=1855346 RepID=UPI00089CA74F|nr:hypothetical protein [Streptomyces sp. 2131.1]SEE85421.1 hypothetical protein SAMN05216483_6803 [Streptomyces sp. 2131.1]